MTRWKQNYVCRRRLKYSDIRHRGGEGWGRPLSCSEIMMAEGEEEEDTYNEDVSDSQFSWNKASSC